MKYGLGRWAWLLPRVRPLAGAGIEIPRYTNQCTNPAFAPTRGRAVKYLGETLAAFTLVFAPSRGRELKLRD